MGHKICISSKDIVLVKLPSFC